MSNWPRFYGIQQNGWWHGLLLGNIVELLKLLSLSLSLSLSRTSFAHNCRSLTRPAASPTTRLVKGLPPGIAATTRESRPATLAFPFPQVSIFKPPPSPNLLQTTQPETGGGGAAAGGARFTLLPYPFPPLLSFRVHTHRSRPTFSLTHVASCPFFMSYRIFIYLSYLCVLIYSYLFILFVCIYLFLFIYLSFLIYSNLFIFKTLPPPTPNSSTKIGTNTYLIYHSGILGSSF